MPSGGRGKGAHSECLQPDAQTNGQPVLKKKIWPLQNDRLDLPMPPSAPNICQNGHNYKHFSAADISCQTTVDLKSNVVAHSGQIGMAVCTTKANLMPSGGFRGGPSQLPPPFGRWTDTVTVLLVMLASAKF